MDPASHATGCSKKTTADGTNALTRYGEPKLTSAMATNRSSDASSHPRPRHV